MRSPDTRRGTPARRSARGQPLRARRALPGVAAKAALALGVFALTLAMGEGVLRLLPGSQHYFVHVPDTQKVFSPDPRWMPGIEGISRFIVNSEGMRGPALRGDGDDAYRILAIGGSTTECVYLDQSETWTHLLQDELTRSGVHGPVWVGNVGRSGLTSRHHVVQARYLLRQYPTIDAVVVLVGVNDLTRSLMHGPNESPAARLADADDQAIRRAFAIAPGKLHQPRTAFLFAEGAPAYKKTALWQLLKRSRLWFSAQRSRDLVQDEEGQVYERWRQHRRNAAEILDETPPLDAALRVYRRNLIAIADVARDASVRLVFVTQPALWRADLTAEEEASLWLGGVGNFQETTGNPYYASRVLADAMSQYNAVLLDVCRERSIECIDLAGSLEASLANFYDDVHFTERGAAAVAEIIGARLGARTVGAATAPAME